MIGAKAVGDLLKYNVSISRFNRGEAGKVFNEVNETGMKIVFKNNRPVCVLLSPAVFEDLQEMLEDYRLLREAEERVKKADAADYVSEEEAMKKLGLTEKDLKKANLDNA